MGIEKFIPFIESKCPTAQFQILVSDFAGHRLAMDGSGVCYAYYSKAYYQAVQQMKVEELLNETGEPDYDKVLNMCRTRLINGLIKRLFENQILPVTVSDGPAPPEKRVKVDREAVRTQLDLVVANLQHKIRTGDNVALNITNLKKKASQRNTYAHPIIREMHSLFFNLGLPTLQAPQEADPVCGFLSRYDYCMGVIGRDTDILIHGARFLLTKFNWLPVGSTVNVLSRVHIMYGLGLNEDQLTELAILAGNDYNDHMPGMAITTAFKSYNHHKSLDMMANLRNSQGLPIYDFTCLRIDVCRRMFRPYTGADLGDYLSYQIQNELIIDANKTYQNWTYFTERGLNVEMFLHYFRNYPAGAVKWPVATTPSVLESASTAGGGGGERAVAEVPPLPPPAAVVTPSIPPALTFVSAVNRGAPVASASGSLVLEGHF